MPPGSIGQTRSGGGFAFGLRAGTGRARSLRGNFACGAGSRRAASADAGGGAGNWYFSLKDRAAQRCVNVRSRNVLVDFVPREGDELELVANVGLYEARGEFQLGVESMRRAGQGQLFEQFLRLKERLAAEGLFDEAVKPPDTARAAAIGVMTSLQAAALHEIVTTLRGALLRSTDRVPRAGEGQGAGARSHGCSRSSRPGRGRVVILARGGGSIGGPVGVQREVVARAVRACGCR